MRDDAAALAPAALGRVSHPLLRLLELHLVRTKLLLATRSGLILPQIKCTPHSTCRNHRNEIVTLFFHPIRNHRQSDLSPLDSLLAPSTPASPPPRLPAPLVLYAFSLSSAACAQTPSPTRLQRRASGLFILRWQFALFVYFSGQPVSFNLLSSLSNGCVTRPRRVVVASLQHLTFTALHKYLGTPDSPCLGERISCASDELIVDFL